MSKKKKKQGFNVSKKRVEVPLVGLQESELGLPPETSSVTGIGFEWKQLLNPITVLSGVVFIQAVMLITDWGPIRSNGSYLVDYNYWGVYSTRLTWGLVFVVVAVIVGSAPFWRIWDEK